MRKTIQKAIMSAAAFLLASFVVLAQGPQTVRGLEPIPSEELLLNSALEQQAGRK